VLLLPRDPDAAAEALRQRLQRHYGVPVGVIISDSFGRAWRRGTCGIAIGAAGLPSLIDLRGQPDLFGRTLEVSIIGFADEIAAAASLLQGQAAEAQPVVLVRGLTWKAPDTPAAHLVRPEEEDLFR
jgi:coenzyme F420-0:L-glutamate ligase/coenzyme F420-1:gamma-L-glutamate ligase